MCCWGSAPTLHSHITSSSFTLTVTKQLFLFPPAGGCRPRSVLFSTSLGSTSLFGISSSNATLTAGSRLCFPYIHLFVLIFCFSSCALSRPIIQLKPINRADCTKSNCFHWLNKHSDTLWSSRWKYCNLPINREKKQQQRRSLLWRSLRQTAAAGGAGVDVCYSFRGRHFPQ